MNDKKWVPEPMPGTHLARVDCIDCGCYTLAVPTQADNARCSACWLTWVDTITQTVS